MIVVIGSLQYDLKFVCILLLWNECVTLIHIRFKQNCIRFLTYYHTLNGWPKISPFWGITNWYRWWRSNFAHFELPSAFHFFVWYNDEYAQCVVNIMDLDLCVEKESLIKSYKINPWSSAVSSFLVYSVSILVFKNWGNETGFISVTCYERHLILG